VTPAQIEAARKLIAAARELARRQIPAYASRVYVNVGYACWECAEIADRREEVEHRAACSVGITLAAATAFEREIMGPEVGE
jgi:hypothetical protein